VPGPAELTVRSIRSTHQAKIGVQNTMEIYAQDLLRPAVAVAVLATAAGLILTGCGPSSGSSAASAQSTVTSSAASSAAGQSSGGSAAKSTSGSASTVVASGSLPFPTTTGDTWYYKNTDGSTSENKIGSVTQTAAGQDVLMDTTLTDNGTTTRDHYSYVVQPNGQISLPVGQFGDSSVSIKLISGGLYWPSSAQLSSGQAYHSTMTMAFAIAGKTQTVTAHITATGEGTQSVTVPAGTYSATVVSMLESEKVEGVNVTTDVKTWLAPGVGPVQSEMVDVDGATQTISNKEELTSFVKG
jgi:hypothetical protein